MKKIIVIHLGRKGAGPVYTIEMVKALLNFPEQIDISVIISSECENISEWDSLQNVLTLKKVHTYNSKLSFLFSLFRFTTFYDIIKFIRLKKPDYVYATMPHLWDPFIFPFINKHICVKTIHDVILHEGERGLINRLWHYTFFRNASKFIILSSKYKSLLISKGISKDNILVIPHAGMGYYIKSPLSALKNDSDVLQLLFFGRIVKYKGLEVLLNAIYLLINEGVNVHLNIVGNGSLKDYESLIERVRENVSIFNYWIRDDEVANFLQKSDVVILPYTQASQSGVIPLAYSFKKAVVASDVGCISEQVIHKKTGLLVKPNDVLDLKNKIKYICENREALNLMSQSAYDFALKELTWDESANKLIKFLYK